MAITRRVMLASVPGSLLSGTLFASVSTPQKPKSLPQAGEFFRFLDPVTETPIVRLTSVTSSSYLPAPANRFVSVKDRFLLFSSDRTGGLAPFHLDLRNGSLMQLAQTRKLAPQSICLAARKNSAYLLDDNALVEVALGNRKTRTIAENVTSFCELDAGTSFNFVVIRNGRLEQLGENGSKALAQDAGDLCLLRPGGRGCLFSRRGEGAAQEFWYAPLSGAGDESPLKLVSGSISNPIWTRDGQRLLFLRDVPHTDINVSEVHAVSPETGTEENVATTSQFAAFSPNADTSVLVGASRSKAQPTVLLLLTSVRRELTLCEHRAKHPAAVSPVFSPDSKRVYFQSDHEGKSALYSVNVEKLVESTPDG